MIRISIVGSRVNHTPRESLSYLDRAKGKGAGLSTSPSTLFPPARMEIAYMPEPGP